MAAPEASGAAGGEPRDARHTQPAPAASSSSAQPGLTPTPASGSTRRLEVARSAFLAAALLVAPVSSLLGLLAFAAYMALVCAEVRWREALAESALRLQAGLLVLWVGWLLARAVPPWGMGWHKLRLPMVQPVTAIDWAAMAGVILLLRLAPRWREVAVLLSALLATLALQVIFAAVQLLDLLAGPWRWAVESRGLLLVELYLAGPPPGGLDAGFSNRNIFGVFLVYCLIGALWLWSHARRRWLVGLLLAAAAVASALLAMSGSRSALFAGGLSAGVLGWWVRRERGLKSGRAFWLVAGVAALALASLAARDWGASLERLSSTRPLLHRGRLLGCMLELLGEGPWLGTGIGVAALRCEARLGLPVNHAHNLFLQWIVDLGIPVGSAVSAGLVWLYLRGVRLLRASRDASRSPRAAVLAVSLSTLALSLTGLPVLHAPQLELTFFWCLAMAVSPASRLEAPGAPPGAASG